MKTTKDDAVKPVPDPKTEPRSDKEIVDSLVQEAKDHWLPNSETPANDVAEKLFARIASDETASRLRAIPGGEWGHGSEWGFLGPLAALGAVAAGVAFFMHPASHVPGSIDGLAETPSEVGASLATGPRSMSVEPAELRSEQGTGDVFIDHVAVQTASLRQGETIEARGEVARFIARGRVDWLLESGTEVLLERAGDHGGAIVLNLHAGAVEAQVVPVPRGEAFAVDVDGVRVAVHGTHLRVERRGVERRGVEHGPGSQVVVDLSEGVISVGAPPRAGSTVGVLVTAPAHVEFSSENVEGTLVVNHDEASVRTPVDLGSEAHAAAQMLPTAPLSQAEPANPSDPRPLVPPMGFVPRTPVGVASATPPKPLTPLEIIDEAVKRCADQTLPRGPVAVTVSSILTVDVNSDGVARLASFNPPLVPELQSCVGQAVYATHWTEAGPYRIPIELHR